MKRHPFARIIGNSYAHLQHSLDELIEWSVVKLKNVDTPRQTKEPVQGNRYLRFTGKAFRSTLGFLGTMTESYFTKYRDLKSQEKNEVEKPT